MDKWNHKDWNISINLIIIIAQLFDKDIYINSVTLTKLLAKSTNRRKSVIK